MRNRAKNQMILALIRHGKTKGNEERRYVGRTDEPLSKEGIANLRSYKQQNLYPEVKYLFSSPMRRCLETAQILYPDLSPDIIPEWAEIDFGRFEYKNYEELRNDTEYQAWVGSGGALPFPKGESREEFISRCKAGFLNMCGKLCRAEDLYAERPVKAGIIVHGGTIMALLSEHGGNSYFDYQVSNGRGYRCGLQGWGSRARIAEMEEI